MIEFVHKNNHENVVLFIHGFTGGTDTWKHPEHGYFFDQLLENETIRENFDLASFEYYTRLTNLFAGVDSGVGRLLSLFKTIQPKSKKNISVEEISEMLRTRIRFDLADYRNVIIVAHSMGGLVAKAAIIKDLQKNYQTKVSLVISLAVPHLGANLATYGKLLSNNKQIEDLAPLSELCPALNSEWINFSIKPEIKYFYGAYDSIVVKDSAVGMEVGERDVVVCDEDHLSISKPAGPASLVITATATFLKDFLKSNSAGNPLPVRRLDNPDQYNDEIFVLKLILADVHNATVKQSKEHFLNAEYARKLFSSAADQEKLRVLYDKVRTVYQNSYSKHLGESGANSTKFVAEVHQKIVSEDANYLKSALPLIHGLHKIGMLHQLANDLQDDIWWGEDQSLEALESLKQALNKATA